MKSIKFTFLFLLIVCVSKADVIFSPDANKGFALSIEGIASYELTIAKRNTINFWGGIGLVSPINHVLKPSFGGEIATEIRYYFSDNYEGFNLGLYAGLAFMKQTNFNEGRIASHDILSGFVPGIKLTYKCKSKSKIICEPYFGISTPKYLNRKKEFSRWRYPDDPEFIFTIGLRIGFNKVNRK
jgi:hypothetical protein